MELTHVHVKGTVSIFSSEPPCKNYNVRSTMVPLKSDLINKEFPIYFRREIANENKQLKNKH